SLRVAIGIDNNMGHRITHLDTALFGSDLNGLLPGVNTVRVVIPKMMLFPGRYRMTIFSSVNGAVADWIKDAVSFDVESGDFYGAGHLPLPSQAEFLSEHRFVLGNEPAGLQQGATFDRLPGDCTSQPDTLGFTRNRTYP